MATTTTTTTTTCSKFLATATFLLVAASSYGGVWAQAPVSAPETPGTAASPGPAAGNDCFTALLGTADCLTYVEEGSNLTKPDKACCPELSNLVNTNPICLCQLLGNPNATASAVGVKIDVNKAIKLPSVCKVETPPVSTCSAVGVPVSLPPSTKHSISPKSSHGGVHTKAPVSAPETPVTAASPGPAAGNDCFTALLGMSDCLTYVEEGSNLTKPDKACCPELSQLVNNNPICLCQLLGNPNATTGAVGVKVDVNRAIKLPSVCKVDTPPVSTCSAVGVPVSLPPSYSLSPSGEPLPGSAPTPSESGADTASPVGQPTVGAVSSPTSGGAASSPSPNLASSIKEVSILPFIFGSATAFISIVL